MVDTDELRAFAVDLAREAGDLLTSYATRRSLRVGTKSSRTDPVSEADHASERLITDRIVAARPDDGILGEEDAANRPGSSGLRWVVDPLDGTVNFLYRIPQWCVSIACADDHGPLVGVVHDPSRDETFVAERGRGATLDGERIEVAAPDGLASTLLATGFGYDPDVRVAQGGFAAALIGEVRDLRRGGSAALDLAWTAAGRYDAYAEFGLNPWDWHAGRLLVDEAGGRTSMLPGRFAGRDLDGLIASGPGVHDDLVELVRASL